LTDKTARILQSISDIDPEVWDQCANPPGAEPYNPFLRHAFLKALEDSGSATADTGWQPFHLVLEEPEAASGKVLGVVPLYMKGHSQGEYVFDYAWADAWHRAGHSYYPKLQGSVPFTPATGRRLLAAPDAPADTEELLLGACMQVAEQTDVSSVHFTFMPEKQWQSAGQLGYLRRMDQQFHWQNNGYETFEDFLTELSSKKRKNVRRERRDALANGINIHRLTGDALKEEHWDAFYRFYEDTGARKWGSPYLTRKFFSLINQHTPEDILLVLCEREGRYIAGAINFIGSDCLYGRNWGCLEDHPFLHFETCYYQAIEFAIERGLSRVEAGAQGAHKVARGYLPQATYSAHFVRDPQFREAVAKYLDEERAYVREDIDHIRNHTPFRSDVALPGPKPPQDT